MRRQVVGPDPALRELNSRRRAGRGVLGGLIVVDFDMQEPLTPVSADRFQLRQERFGRSAFRLRQRIVS